MGCVFTLEDPHGSWVVIDTSGGLQGGDEDGWRWDEIVGEGIVEVTLQALHQLHGHIGMHQHSYLKLEDILHLLEFLLVSVAAM